MRENMLLLIWFSISIFFVGFSGAYFIYMKKMAKKPWGLTIDEKYEPSVAILVPVHNEERTIQLKLRNLSRVSYPAKKVEAFILNDASTDNTLEVVRKYVASNQGLKISVFDNQTHLGKTNCLNLALKSVKADVVVVSDADCFWSSDILLRALPYLSDSSVGAITARELLLNPQDSWVTRGEQFYNDSMTSIKIGESKVHSAIFFYGGFAAYKRTLLSEFDHDVDDSGTALNLVQRNIRTLLIPEIAFYTPFPTIWKNKITLKIRRASNLQQIEAKCLNLLLHRKLVLPKRIAIPQIILHIFNPLILVALAVISIFVFIQYPLIFLALLLAFGSALLVRKTRITVVEAFQNNLILLLALGSFFTGKKFKLWKTLEESRTLITESVLKEKKLI
jgi:cellulose synthase/poly-beta-1,6-N-acetylglucosamine synthase-like glycosyltransferase